MPRIHRSQLTLDERVRIVALKAEGKTLKQIAIEFQRSVQAISDVIKKYRETGTVSRQEGSGRPRKLSESDIHNIILAIKRDRRISAEQIVVDLGLHGVSPRTITRAVRLFSPFRSKWCTKKPFISIKNIKHRVKWCREHLDWSIEDWLRVVWSDESPYYLRNAVRFRVWRCMGERLKKEYCKGTVKHDKKINVWGCFSGLGIGPLHRIHGIMDKHVYLDILKEKALPWCEEFFPADEDGDHDYLFQQDKDPKHTAKLVMRWMKKNMNLIHADPKDWPAQSPDLNPIENLWAYLDYKTKDRVCNTEEELFQVLEEAWHNLPVDYLRNLASSMPNRLEAVLVARGGPTKY
jgi:transposase